MPDPLPYLSTHTLQKGFLCCRMPPLIYLIVRKPSMRSGHYWASWFCIVFGVLHRFNILEADFWCK